MPDAKQRLAELIEIRQQLVGIIHRSKRDLRRIEDGIAYEAAQIGGGATSAPTAQRNREVRKKARFSLQDRNLLGNMGISL